MISGSWRKSCTEVSGLVAGQTTPAKVVSGGSLECSELGLGTQTAQCSSALEQATKCQARQKGSVQRSAALPRSHAEEYAQACRTSSTCSIQLRAFSLQRSTTMADIIKITTAVVLTKLCVDEGVGVWHLQSDAMVMQALSP